MNISAKEQFLDKKMSINILNWFSCKIDYEQNE